MKLDLPFALFAAGLIHLAIAASSLAIPALLDWRRRLAPLDRFTRDLFWVYATFILLTNVGFGVLLVLAPDEIASGSPLGRAVAGLVGFYWLARLGVQTLVFDRSELDVGRLATACYHALTLSFVYLALVAAWAAICPDLLS